MLHLHAVPPKQLPASSPPCHDARGPATCTVTAPAAAARVTAPAGEPALHHAACPEPAQLVSIRLRVQRSLRLPAAASRTLWGVSPRQEGATDQEVGPSGCSVHVYPDEPTHFVIASWEAGRTHLLALVGQQLLDTPTQQFLLLIVDTVSVLKLLVGCGEACDTPLATGAQQTHLILQGVPHAP